MNNYLKNWKTTLAGVIVLLTYVLCDQGIITEDVKNSVFALGIFFGLFNAVDIKRPGSLLVVFFASSLVLSSCGLIKNINKDDIVKIEKSDTFKLFEFYFENKLKDYLDSKGIKWEKNKSISFSVSNPDFQKFFGNRIAQFLTNSGSVSLNTSQKEFSLKWMPRGPDSTQIGFIQYR